MKKLSTNWITEGMIDFEYKKYILLAYLKHVNKNFDATKLYPCLADLFQHYANLKHLQYSKNSLSDKAPKTLSKIDVANLLFEYEQQIEGEVHLKDVNKIIDFALPQFEKYLETGKQIYQHVEDHLNVFPIGLLPLKKEEGYFFVAAKSERKTSVYQYQISLFEKSNEKYRSLKTTFVANYNRSISLTYESIKYKLIEEKRELPNPATYVVESELSFPTIETMLPIAKRHVMRIVATD